MEEAPIISVIIPAYNVEKYIGQCLTSILIQGVADIEILVYDDGSRDGTLRIVESFNDTRIKVFRGEQNKGVVFARNVLLKAAQGEFIAFQDADDWSHKDRLSNQLNYLLSRPHIGACGTQFIKVLNGRPIFFSDFPCDAGTIKSSIPEQFLFLPGSVLMRKKVLDKVGLYDPFFANDGNEDTYLTSKVILTCGFENLDCHLYFYSLNLRSLTKFSHLTARKLYIREINSVLLDEFIRSGTNVLESHDYCTLSKIESDFKIKYSRVKRFTVFERVIGQLIFYKRYILAVRQVVLYALKTGDVLNSFRLLFYILRKVYSV